MHLTAELAYWITERYSILLRRREGLAKPWSGDRIFQTVRFCNVHREDDAVTIWIRQNWNLANDPAWKFVLGRMINWPDSLEGCIPWNTPEGMKEQLQNHRARGHKIFTSAYTISTCGRQMDKLDYVVDHVIASVKKNIDEEVTRLRAFSLYASLEQTWEWLTTIDGLGSFLAAQVVADMKNTQGHRLMSALDWWTWSAPGPGSLRGLGWYFNQNPESVTARQYEELLHECRKEVDPLIPEYVPRISAQDFQNCLCEFSKYCKVKYQNGHVRNKYDGRT